MILENLGHNVETARRVVAGVVRTLPATRDCSCPSALATALVTSPELVPEETKLRLAPIIGRLMPAEAAT